MASLKTLVSFPKGICSQNELKLPRVRVRNGFVPQQWLNVKYLRSGSNSIDRQSRICWSFAPMSTSHVGNFPEMIFFRQASWWSEHSFVQRLATAHDCVQSVVSLAWFVTLFLTIAEGSTGFCRLCGPEYRPCSSASQLVSNCKICGSQGSVKSRLFQISADKKPQWDGWAKKNIVPASNKWIPATEVILLFFSSQSSKRIPVNAYGARIGEAVKSWLSHLFKSSLSNPLLSKSARNSSHVGHCLAEARSSATPCLIVWIVLRSLFSHAYTCWKIVWHSIQTILEQRESCESGCNMSI